MNENLPVLADSFQRYMAEINRVPLLSRQEEEELASRYVETGNREAAQKMVVANLRFVVKVAYEYRSYGFKMADLIQEGNLGLMMAVKKFDPKKGYRLISYAVWWIRAYIQNFILRSWSLVKIGTTQAQRKLFYKLRQTKRKLFGALGESDPDKPLSEGQVDYLAEKLALKGHDVAEMDARLSGRDLSLNAPVGDDAKQTHLDLLSAPADQEELVGQQEEADQLSQQVSQALTTLNPREQFIVSKRLMADEPMTLQDIGTHFGVSRERARQLEARAKQKLRTALQ